MCKRWFWVILAVVACAILFVTVAVAAPEREPEYGKKKLSEWVKIFAEGLDSAHRSNETERAAEAIRAIGTNGVPYLVEWSAPPPDQWHALRQGFNYVAALVKTDWIRIDEYWRRAHASLALMALDYEMIEASGRAKEWLADRRNESLRLIQDRDSFADLIVLLTNGFPSADLKIRVSFGAGLIGTNSTTAIPVIEALFNNSSPHVRRAATNAVRRIRGGKL